MRFLIAFLCAVLLSALSIAQKRILVSPNQEVIPIPPGSSAQKLIAKYGKGRAGASVTDRCSGGAQFGFDPTHFPTDTRFGFSHKDVMGEWFVAPARGTIDTFFFEANGSIGLPDSLVIVRILKSNISPGHGPGYDYPSPCRSWGYWIKTDDPEGGITPFIEDATDTNWHSTIETDGGTKPSFEPFGLSVWGMGGVAIKLQPLAINAIPMDLIPGGFQIKSHSPGVKDTIDIGESFFFSLRMNGLASPGHYPDPISTQFGASSSGGFPARDWKFYQQDSGPGGCIRFQDNHVKKGWIARGSLSVYADANSGSAFNVWYVMTPTTNVPPKLGSVDRLEYTISTGSRTITAEIFDCDAENPGHSGVESAYVRYSFNDLAGNTLFSASMPMDNIGGDTYTGTLPGAAKNTIVHYKFFYFDSTGLADSSAEFRYRVVDFDSRYYRADTTLACTPMSIAGTGTAIGASEWFLPPRTANSHRGDDGTAGPLSLGGPFVYFGDTVNYAWAGVNGAIALSKTATDRLDVNANGFATDTWDLPQRQYHGQSDISGQDAGLMPKNFIAPFWANWIANQDAPPATFGHIRYSSTAYPGKFVVEWDSIGSIGPAGAVPDDPVFRVILECTTGTVRFQYDEIGKGGSDFTNLVGIQSDSLTYSGPVTPFNFFNKDGFPAETHLHNGICLSYYPCAFQLTLFDGWNLLSLGVVPPAYSRSFLFPTAVTGSAFGYRGSYFPTPTLASGGGYWLKFRGSQTICVPGTPVLCIDDTVEAGWNIIGSASKSALVSTIMSTPPAIVSSPYFGFSGSYFVATELTPGHAYWIKSAAAGVLHICASSGAVPKQAAAVTELAGLDRVTIQDKSGSAQTLYIGSDGVLSAEAASKYEMPPGAPGGGLDVRFSSGRMVEVYPSQTDPGKQYEYPISIQGAEYPLVVKWEAVRGSTQKLALTEVNGKDTKTLGFIGGSGVGSGKVTIFDAGVTKLVLKLTEGLAIPKEFALSQNYPNPFNPTTHFSVEIPRASGVDITVYDMLGRKIANLMSGEQEAGHHIVEWDSKDSRGLTVPSGMYMVRMIAGDFTAVRKVVVLR